MRISTAMYYSSMSNSSSRITGDLQKISDQLSSGKRISSSADDPVAYYKASMLKEQIGIKSNTISGWSTIDSRAKEVEDTLSNSMRTVNDLRDWIITAKTESRWSDSASLEQDTIKNLKSQLMALANSKNAAGDYIFSGFQNTTPFVQTASGVKYMGDQGTREVPAGQESIGVEPTGFDTYMFKSESSVAVSSATNWYGGNNLGNAYVSATSTTSLTASYSMVFAVDRTTTPPTNKVDVLDSSGNSIVNGTNRTTGTNQGSLPLTLPSDGALDLSSYLGQPANSTVIKMTGQPEDGDQYNLTPSTRNNIFDVFDSVLTAMTATYTSTTSLAHNNLQSSTTSTPSTTGTQGWNTVLDQALEKIDQWLNNTNQQVSKMGALQSRAEDEKSGASAIQAQYEAQRSDLEDLDYSSALMRQSQLNTQLQALYKTFSSGEGMSLFKYLA